MAGTNRKRIVIVGGGSAGITVAAELHAQDASHELDISVIEPSDVHYYQPAFTLVGVGEYTLDKTRRPEASVIPSDVHWIQGSAQSFQPEANSVTLSSGAKVEYDYLVVCPGLKLNWDAVSGLKDSVGKNGVCSNYSPDTVEYTFECVKGLKSGAKALFTQPAMPIKCPGAPQKAAYLTSDYLRRSGIRKHCEVRFLTQTPAIFGVPFYARELMKVVEKHGILAHFQHNLVEIDAAGRKATFEITGGDQSGQRVTFDYDMIHVTPPQGAPDFLKGSPVANEAGFVDVHANSLQHTKYPNIFGLGDAASTANSKTAAAVRKQAPVVTKNIWNLIAGRPVEESYDGYASCPLTTEIGKVLMAEFIYGGKPTPTLPLDPAKERWVNWFIKKTGLPIMYWDYMLKGHIAFPGHNTDFVDPGA